MKPSIQRILAGLLLLLLLPGILMTAALSLPAYYQESYYAELPAMVRHLRQTPGPRLIVIGGSNVAFGLNGEQLEQTLAARGHAYHVCPFGLYAAVGASAMLDLAEGELHQGDLVVLALEPESEALSTYFGATAFLKCAESSPDLLLRVSRGKQAALIGNAIPFLQERWAIRSSGILPRAEGVYTKAAFNDRCDMNFDRPGNNMALGFDPAEPIDLAALTIEDAFAAQLRRFCDTADRRGAKVVLSFCPINRLALTDHTDAAVQASFDLFNRTISCPVISDPRRYLLDSGWFYDSNVHLNSTGAILRTQLLAEDLLAFFGDFAPLPVSRPDMPASIYSRQEQYGDADAFVYLPLTDDNGALIGYQVDGLTEIGCSADELSVPSSWKGLPVVTFSPHALAGADQLVQLTIPDSIEMLPDRLFAGLPALRRLILLHQDRLCTITDHTFDDAELTIHVPAAAYPLYRDGQGCETNRWYPLLSRIIPMQ